MTWLAIMLCVLANITANLCFKRAMTEVDMPLTLNGALQVLGRPWLWAGLLCASIVLTSYLYAIRGLPVGLAYSIVTSSVVVGTLLAGYVLFNEHLNAATIAGIVFVGIGVTLIATQQLGA